MYSVPQEGPNQGWFFRWSLGPEQLGVHQIVYAFVFAQYCAVCRGALLEIYEDTSPSGTRDLWTFRYRQSVWSPGQSGTTNPLNPTWPLGSINTAPGEYALSKLHSLLVVPFGRQKVLFLPDTGNYLIATVRAHPNTLADRSDWDILRADSIEVWALTPQAGLFQVQRVKYPVGVNNLYLPDLTMEYTPLIFPSLKIFGDANNGTELIQTPLSFPKDYVFAKGPLSDDCPAPTNLASGQGRTFGERIRFHTSVDQKHSPQLYSLELTSEPIFQPHPLPAVIVDDKAPISRLLHADLSFGSNPGDGRMTVRLLDTPGAGAENFPLASYYFRSEMPVQLVSEGVPIFTGYTNRTEVQPWRGEESAPVELRMRCNDRWLLLESTILREQRDWQKIGHISVVDAIVRQCGIDTGVLVPDGSFDEQGNAILSGGSLAEYPAGWDGRFSSTYNTPLGTPILTNDNQEGNQLLGWKPQPHDTGASFLKRITDLFSNWLLGFRGDGTFYYLPYKYFSTSSLTFHAHGNRSVASGLNLNVGVGLTVVVTGGTVQFPQSMTINDTVLGGLAPNTTNTVYAQPDGTVTSNVTGLPPPGAVTLGTVTTGDDQTISVDQSASSPRQTPTSKVYRRPVEYRTIEPSGNFVYAVSHFQLDQTANRSAIFVDWASLRNPLVVNYLGRVKWFPIEIGGAFSCAQLNRMAYIAFQSARRRRQRVSFSADYVPSLKIGQIFTLEGIGNFRLLELRTVHVRASWQIANYVGERVEKGYGLP
jgi:hypothetical protein